MKHRQAKNSIGIEIGYLADHPEVIRVVAGWIFNEWSFLYPGKTAALVEAFLAERLHKRKLPLTLVAFKRSKPVGTVSLKEFEIESRKDLSPWVVSLYVVKRWRGKGIGGGLMKAAEEKAARLGIRRLYLFTDDSGIATGFYSRLGWATKERSTYKSYPIILLEKRIR